MGTSFEQGYINTGGRVLFVMDLAHTLQEARERVYHQIQHIQSEGLFYRHDIGLSKEVSND
jgi:phosphoribosylamine--glycine ligase